MLARKKLLGDYNVGKTIGQGAFSKVKIGFHRETGEKVAIKIIDKKLMALKAAKAKQAQEEREKRKRKQEEEKRKAAGLPPIESENTNNAARLESNNKEGVKAGTEPGQDQSNVPSFVKELQTEVQLLMRLEHPNIIKIYEVLDTEDECYVIMEYASGGELVDFIAARGYLSEKEARRFFRQMISAVDHCHLAKVVHRDLKLENMLLSNQRNILISDFGLGRTIRGDTDEFLKTFCGTPNYAAVELVSGIPYVGTRSDIWAMGVILYVMATGKLPFQGETISALYAKIKAVDYKCPDYFSPSLKDLLSTILVKDPKKRTSMDQLREHEWVNFEEIERPPRIYPQFYSAAQVNPAQFIKGIVFDQNCTIYVFHQHTPPIVPLIDPNFSNSQNSPRRRRSRSTVLTFEESSKLAREVAALNGQKASINVEPVNKANSSPGDSPLLFEVPGIEPNTGNAKEGTAGFDDLTRSRRFTISGGTEPVGEFLGNSPFVMVPKPSETPVSPMRPTLSTPFVSSANPLSSSAGRIPSLSFSLSNGNTVFQSSVVPTKNGNGTNLSAMGGRPGEQPNMGQHNHYHVLTLPANVESELMFLRRMSSPTASNGLPHVHSQAPTVSHLSTDDGHLMARLRSPPLSSQSGSTENNGLQKSASITVGSGELGQDNLSISSAENGAAAHSKSLSFTTAPKKTMFAGVSNMLDKGMSHLPLASNDNSHSGIFTENRNSSTASSSDVTPNNINPNQSIENLSVEKVAEWHQLHCPAKQIRSVRFPFSNATTSSWPPHEIFFEVHRVLILLKARYPGQFTFQRLVDYYLFECKLDIPSQEPLTFEVEVCKVWLMKLHGVKIKRNSGNAMLFKDVYELITSELCLE